MGLSQTVATMQLKLLAALPPERQAAAQRLIERFHLDPVGWGQNPEAAERLPALANAVSPVDESRCATRAGKGRSSVSSNPSA